MSLIKAKRMIKSPLKKIVPGRVLNSLYQGGYFRIKWSGSVVPRMALAGMTSVDEQMYFTRCAGEMSGVEGDIVDLGCWMCSTSISLARGVPAGATAKIYAIAVQIKKCRTRALKNPGDLCLAH